MPKKILTFTRAKYRPVVKTHGGRFYTCRRILDLARGHPYSTLVDPFCGGGSIVFNAPPGVRRVVNDVDPFLASIFQCLAEPLLYAKYKAALLPLTYDKPTFLTYRTEYRRMRDAGETADVLHTAIVSTVVRRFSRGGLMGGFCEAKRLRGGEPESLHAWNTFLRDLDEYAAVLKGANVTCQDFSRVMSIRLTMFPGPFLYLLDPPYVKSCRTSTRIFGQREMSDDRHREMLGLAQARAAEGHLVMIMGAPSQLYEEALPWGWLALDVPNRSSQGHTKLPRRAERVWCSWMGKGEVKIDGQVDPPVDEQGVSNGQEKTEDDSGVQGGPV